MIGLSELPATLRDFIAQFGPPNDSNLRMYTSLIHDALVQNPREAQILEISLRERIPEHLSHHRDTIETAYPWIIREFSGRTGVDLPSAEWVIKVWMDALGIPLTGSDLQQQSFQAVSPPHDVRYETPGVQYPYAPSMTPGQTGGTGWETWNAPNQDRQYAIPVPGGFQQIPPSPSVNYEGNTQYPQSPPMVSQGAYIPDVRFSSSQAPQSRDFYPPGYGQESPQPYPDSWDDGMQEGSRGIFSFLSRKTILIPVIFGICLVLLLFFSGILGFGTHDVSGKWMDTDGITITLTQDGDKVTGNFLIGEKLYDYADMGVDLSGTLSGNVLAFTYTSTTIRNQIITPSRGEGKITFANSFNSGNLEFNSGIMSGDHLNGDKKYPIRRVMSSG